jgi:tetratricopeptide (TPR) repeat protein
MGTTRLNGMHGISGADSDSSHSTVRSALWARTNTLSVSSKASSSASSASRPVREGSLRRANVNKESNSLWMIGPISSTASKGKDMSKQDAGIQGTQRDGIHAEGGSERTRKLRQVASENGQDLVSELESNLDEICEFKGQSSRAYLEASEQLIRVYNNMAMQLLQSGSNAQALELLQSAEGLIGEASAHHNLDRLKGLTYNNLGCYFRREGMPMEALKWLRQAHDIEQRMGSDASARSSTYLNLCAVYSLLGKHQDALQCAQQALKYLKIACQQANAPSAPGDNHAMHATGADNMDKASMLAIAYHNIAVEHEYLGHLLDAVHAYRKALEVAEAKCGDKSALAAKIRVALTAAANAAAEQQENMQRRRLGAHAHHELADAEADAHAANLRHMDDESLEDDEDEDADDNDGRHIGQAGRNRAVHARGDPQRDARFAGAGRQQERTRHADRAYSDDEEDAAVQADRVRHGNPERNQRGGREENAEQGRRRPARKDAGGERAHGDGREGAKRPGDGHSRHYVDDGDVRVRGEGHSNNVSAQKAGTAHRPPSTHAHTHAADAELREVSISPRLVLLMFMYVCMCGCSFWFSSTV